MYAMKSWLWKLHKTTCTRRGFT